jgi:hypothetical protein
LDQENFPKRVSEEDWGPFQASLNDTGYKMYFTRNYFKRPAPELAIIRNIETSEIVAFYEKDNGDWKKIEIKIDMTGLNFGEEAN